MAILKPTYIIDLHMQEEMSSSPLLILQFNLHILSWEKSRQMWKLTCECKHICTWGGSGHPPATRAAALSYYKTAAFTMKNNEITLKALCYTLCSFLGPLPAT